MFRVLSKIKSKCKGLIVQFYNWNDFRLYANNLSSYKNIAEKITTDKNKGSLLIVSGRGMNILWAQIWTVLSLAVRIHGYKGYVLTTYKQKSLNRYFRLLNLELIFYEDIVKTVAPDLPENIAKTLEKTVTFDDFKQLFYKGAPIGQIALSTHTRYACSGIIDLEKPETRESVIEWIKIVCQAIHLAEIIYKKYDVKIIYINELFFEEYSGFYYTALLKGLNIIKFTGTIRDNAFILQHMNPANERLHHASLSAPLWNELKKNPLTGKENDALDKNFMDRYGHKWYRSCRNHRGTKILPVDEVRKDLNIPAGRKIAVIFSHILYDSLFFFGTDIFENYANWLVETVRVACKNDRIEWFIKVHPYNIWRGELNTFLKGKYEEERLINKFIGELPPHVRIIYANTKINPYSWFQAADYGITVRGTSGLEMAALGKLVITAGTGRYEGKGFTIDPKNKEEYRNILNKLPDIPSPAPKQVELAKLYAHSLFIRKPVEFDFLEPTLKTGVKEVVATDDLIYLPKKFAGYDLPGNLKKISEWVCDSEKIELLS